MEKKHRKTCRRYNTPFNSHHLTFSCFRRRPFLSRDRSRQWLVDGIRHALELHEMTLWAWVMMPEHVHLLVHPRKGEYDISAFLKSMKQPVTNAVLRFVREHTPAFLEQMVDRQPNGKVSHRFWQRGGGYDTNLWTPKYICEKVNYIHQNPVRRGLVKLPTDWRWSSALDFVKGREEPLLPVKVETIPWVP